MTPILLDTDPGIDDAMAIFYAMADPEIELVGMTTVFGNVYTPDGTRNALALCELAGQFIPVAEGAHVPLVQPQHPPADFVHGKHGLGNASVPDPKAAPDPRPAHQFIADTLAARPGEITLVAVGPLTNVALALQHHPEITKTVKKVVVMGGAVRTSGNINEFAEANIWNDPHAAKVVFSADWPVTIVGLDVTERIQCTPEDFAPMRERSPRCGALMNEAAAFYFQFHIDTKDLNACFLHDPAAIICAQQPELFETVMAPITMRVDGEEAGRTVEDTGGNTPRVAICVEPDAAAIKQRFLKHLHSGVLP
jgi:inosine-uridine nucleoside N-ribohydrolase